MAAAGFSEMVGLGERYEIAPGQRLPALDCGMAEAYAVADRVEPGRKLFALIPPGHLSNRGLTLAPQRAAAGGFLLWPIAAGIVDWPVGTDGSDVLWGRRPALVYPKPTGERLFTGTSIGREEGSLPTFTEANLLRQVLQPALMMLRECTLMAVPHRAIHPGNMFYQTDQNGEVMFGDCLAAPVASTQPATFETIENALADPIARGQGALSDDIYALGVTVLMLHLGRNPVAHLSDEQVLHAKINSGSFSALSAGEKFGPAIAELLRGLLSDKLSDRWTIKHLEGWVQGQRFSPVLPGVPQRASRQIRFCGADYLSKQALAQAMARQWDEGITLISNPDFDNWMKRGFGDEKAAEKMNRVISLANATGHASGIRDRMLSRYVIMMGGALPLAYKDIIANVTGIGAALAHYFERPEKLQQIGELLQARLPHNWLEEQPNLRADQMQFRRDLDTVDKVLGRPGLGYGIERVLYELDKGTPCRSALIGDYYVIAVADLLPAIDAAIGAAPSGTLPVDRHIAAFIAAGMKRALEGELAPLADRADDVAYRVGILRLLAIVQRVNQNYDLPRLARVVVEMLEPVLTAVHSNNTREQMRDELARHEATCRFDEMLLLVDPDGPMRRADNAGFAAALQEYAGLEQGRIWLQNGGLTETGRVRAAAQRAAAVTACLICSASLAAYGVAMTLF